MILGVRLYTIIILITDIITPSLVFAQEVAPAAAEPVEPPRIPVTTTIGGQITGLDVEYADVVYATLSVQQARGPKNWYLRGSYSGTYTPYYHVINTRLDYRLEKARQKGQYDVWTGILSRYDYPSPTGYRFMSFGPGKQFDARNKGEVGIGMLSVYDDSDGAKPALSCSLTTSKPLGKNLTIDGRILAIQPMNHLRDTKVDSDIGLSYALTQGLSLRLGWTANNVLRNVSTGKDWTSNKRFTISYNKTTTR